ncbi:MAG: arylsulfatase A [Flavobacteriaceae bacterium]|nr:arylsulfatase A [Flavobacteriaceae bacterium]|tara:strand:+ start:4073 stop:5473 length:1401 start_codon:yes stop_codon:yes gene_type:complete
MKIIKILSLIYISILVLSCANNQTKNKSFEKPNVILIMADDIGFEALQINGADDYKTPVLDSLARNGINFTNAYSQPLCTPTRVKIMTGKPNYINYEYFTYLNPNQKTFGNLFQENGYKTSLVGKWQLNGVQYDLENNQDLNRPYHFGFDEYCLWWLRERGDRFANPNIVQNGKKLETNIDDYGADIFSDFIVDFIEKNKNDPFFIYYPMALVHDPFRPTPDSKDWDDLDKRNSGNDPKYFSDMVTYMDKVVGTITDAIRKNNLDKNTILIFLGDNGTDKKVVTLNNGKEIKGSKGVTIKYGSNVPMILNWNNYINEPRTSDVLIDFTDFYATFEDILNVDKPDSYGKSLIPLMLNEGYKERDILITYYNPMWGSSGLTRGVYAQDKNYKLYKSGKFFKYSEDLFEENPISFNVFSEEENKIYNSLKKSLDSVPALPAQNHNGWKERGTEVKQSNKFNSIWQLNSE